MFLDTVDCRCVFLLLDCALLMTEALEHPLTELKELNVAIKQSVFP